MRGHVRKVGGKWRVTYYDEAANRRARSFVLKRDADAFLTTTQADQARGDWIDPHAGRVTLREYGQKWIATRHVRPTTRERYGYLFRYICRIGDTQIAGLTPSILEQWQLGLLDDLAEATVRVTRSVLAAMLETAVRDRVIPRSPLVGVKAIRVAKHQVEPRTAAEVMSIHDAMHERYRAMVLLAAGCGLRRGEVLGLTVGRVDFLRRTVTVSRAVTFTAAGAAVGPPKSQASRRTVPAPQFVLDGLAAHLARHPAGPDDPIFTATHGGIVPDSTFSYAWHRAAPEGVRFHDLRHFYASTLIRAGRSVKEVQGLMGHESAMVTLDTYGHLWPDDTDRAREAIEAAFKPSDGDEGTAGNLVRV